MNSYEILRHDLENIGVYQGDVVVVHSSLKSMGFVEGGAECVIKALIDTIGKEEGDPMYFVDDPDGYYPDG